MLIDSEIFTEVNPTQGMSDLNSDRDYVQATVVLDAAPAVAELLDASSLNTVLAMLEVIDSAEELALLETLTPAQKRQVWDATPEPIRDRLKQIRTKPGSQDRVLALPLTAEPSLSELELFGQPHDIVSLRLEESSEVEEAEETPIEPELIDLDLSNSLDLVPQIRLVVGDWVVLQAKPRFTAAELTAIWEVLEVQGHYARIVASKLGIRTYPIAWMMLYPKPTDYREPEF